ncbi:MAG: FAD-dependent oxidoreductase [Rickettsiales bacterium]|nr:FAD-dependent oxidoreductase [Rickettsiales bacterium]
MIYDIIILGSGPAGLTAAIYGARANKSILVVGGDSLGGQMGKIAKLENYPGWDGSGMELAEFMKKQAESFGASFVMEHCKNIESKDSIFSIRTDKKSYEAKSVIIATGASPRKLEIAGAKEFAGKGVSYCATCDGFFYSGKTVAVYGGGNSALNDALYLANLAEKVYIIYRKSSFTRAEAILVRRVEEAKNIECVFDTEITEVIGNESGVTRVDTNHGTRIGIDGLFIAIGHEANTDFLPEVYDRDHLGRLLTDPNTARIEDGLFAAGDVRHTGKMQICVATGWGCEAAMDAIAYLNKLK